jgi:hypothetical protein
MVGRRDLLSASGGCAALAPAFAGSGLSNGRFCSELPKRVICGIPVPRGPCQAREVVRARTCKAFTVTSADGLALADQEFAIRTR